ncbi:MAG: LysM peptidoglycan-binding domain-containing protein, partial [Firmicutes bacterium]|nr:LysM peptidoglycan-binding domain-containing protein [Bacillota bacterium]
MYVYTVKSGDSLSLIGRAYGVVPLEIEHLNGLASSELMPGMNLLLPGPAATLMPYTAGARESVASVAMRFGVAPYILAGANGLAPEAMLAHGQILFVPRVIGLNTQIEANGYLIPSGTAADATAIRSSGALTFATIFSYGVTSAGGIAPLPSAQARAAAKAAHMDPVLCVTNFDGTNFSTELAHTVLGNPGLREKVVAALMDTLA